jgi:5-methylcytosine-specific restriction endonuclease McrA
VKARDGHRCRWCGRTNVPTDIHHIRYRRGKVDDVMENLINLCRMCHSFVHGVPTKAKDMIEKHEAQEILFALIDMPAATGLALRRQLLRARQNSE